MDNENLISAKDLSGDFDKCWELAYLARATAVFVHCIETMPEPKRYLESEAKRLGVPSISLVNQATVHGFAYFSLVLLNEAVEKKWGKAELEQCSNNIADEHFDNLIINGTRDFSSNNRKFLILKAIRNGLSHARLEYSDQSITIYDTNGNDRCSITLNRFAKLADLAETFYQQVDDLRKKAPNPIFPQ